MTGTLRSLSLSTSNFAISSPLSQRSCRPLENNCDSSSSEWNCWKASFGRRATLRPQERLQSCQMFPTLAIQIRVLQRSRYLLNPKFSRARTAPTYRQRITKANPIPSSWRMEKYESALCCMPTTATTPIPGLARSLPARSVHPARPTTATTPLRSPGLISTCSILPTMPSRSA